jgi:uncharacterized protein (TIGR02246 family)
MMATEKDKATDEDEIREVMDRFTDAVRNKDLNGVMSLYSPEIVWFDFMAPLQHRGTEAYRRVWERCFDWFEAPIGVEIRDLSITAGNDVAFSHSLIHLNETFKNGQRLDFWMRGTTCFRKFNGRWMITHEHLSIPFDLETNKALWDLKPE